MFYFLLENSFVVLSVLSISVCCVDKEQERERLFEGGSTDSKPKLRTAEEIRAKYRKTGVIKYEYSH